ncbi:FIG035246: DoxX family protein [hydrothermal vent metagenome]|uniref:FIG035246: DoxX family protein n=1 Tax=hydrothermal vent metagenome TaxID=652676 RepID=A0A3B1AC94_9ZZZZ
MDILIRIQSLLDKTKSLDFLGPLALRLYLVPVFWMAGMNKYNGFSDTAAWFGNPDWGLGLPFPTVMAFLATSTELVGAVMLLLGFGVRWISIPLMITMLVAIFSVHWKNGWQAVADPMSCLFNCTDATEAITRLSKAKEVLKENANYDWITEQGSLIISNNGIEWGATYFIMLLALFFIGSGKYVSLDYWIKREFNS